MYGGIETYQSIAYLFNHYTDEGLTLAEIISKFNRWFDADYIDEALFDLFRKMCIDEQLSDVNKTEAKEIPLGSQGFIMTVFTKSGDVMVYQYDQLGRNAYSGYGFFSDSSNKYSVHNLDLTRIWLRLFEGK